MSGAPFAPLSAPLVGTQLIEASAGTGKTHTITTLLLRLLLERELAISEILVVTYTRAATAELRDRVRARLRDVHAALAGDRELSPDLGAFFEGRRSVRERDLAHLARALRNFDEAAIHTIHGFCQRALSDSAFESAAPFEVDFVQDQRPLLRQVVRDYWASSTYRASSSWVRALLERDRPGNLDSLAALVTSHAELPLVPASDQAGNEPDLAPFLRARAAAAALFESDGDTITSLLLGPALKGNLYRRPTRARWLGELSKLPRWGPDELPDFLAKLTPDALSAATKRDHAPPVHPFFDAVAGLLAAVEPWRAWRQRALSAFRVALAGYVQKELLERKRDRGLQSFDDLLTVLDATLRSDASQALVRRLRQQYPAALIDEFQDTDPQQYRIFERLFGQGGSLFLIGDPKQAIYAFRGADVFAYLAASRRAPVAPAGLSVNYRSDPGLIAAVNAVFARAHAPFVLAGIGFVPASPRPGAAARLTGDRGSPLQFLFVDPPTGKLDGETARRLVMAGVAAEVTRLLASEARIEPHATEPARPVEPRDIAILCRTNAQARSLQTALGELGVPSAFEGDSSVFDGPTAAELQRVLSALVRPTQARGLRAALITSMFGLDAHGLHALDADDQAWDGWVDRFASWHQTWQQRGFMQAFFRLLDEAGVQRRLLARPDGERRLTDLLHLAELLHEAAVGQRLGPLSLVAWFADMCASEESRAGLVAEAAQVRLESDARVVRLTTVHRSKGLEYPIVFCPFLWGAAQLHALDRQYVRFHDAEGRLRLDVGSQNREQNLRRAEREALSEHLRLAYVALTRARHRCYVVWGPLPGASRSALGYLLHQERVSEPASDPLAAEPEWIARTVARIKGLDAEAMRTELEALVRATDGAVGVSSLAREAVEPQRHEPSERLSVRQPDRLAAPRFRMLSFTGLASESASPAAAEAGRDRDEGDRHGPAAHDTPIERAAPANLELWQTPRAVRLHDFPAGARAGTLIHEIYEGLDFTSADEGATTEAARVALARYGYPEQWAGALGRAIVESLHVPLGAQPGLCLADIAVGDRLNELEFTLAVGGQGQEASLSELAACFARHAETEPQHVYAGRLAQLLETGDARDRLVGFLRGFMDMVFRHDGRYFIVDYKSNHLGERPQAYSQPLLWGPMHAHHYVLQYHLYTLALDRYLRVRLPGYAYERDFGGVYYLFVRGMDRHHAPLNGVFFDRPKVSMVEALGAALANGAGT
ncbi:MAG: exodeoxyribonuclease V subunit beta [Myxococcales bacterium]|nr:exodeoxyribonuclease V subunit beta [Myxococcales bacterium]